MSGLCGTNNDSNGSGSDSDPWEGYIPDRELDCIIISAIGVQYIILCLVFVVVIIRCCILRRRRKKKKQTYNLPHEVVISNPAGSTGADMHLRDLVPTSGQASAGDKNMDDRISAAYSVVKLNQYSTNIPVAAAASKNPQNLERCESESSVGYSKLHTSVDDDSGMYSQVRKGKVDKAKTGSAEPPPPLPNEPPPKAKPLPQRASLLLDPTNKAGISLEPLVEMAPPMGGRDDPLTLTAETQLNNHGNDEDSDSVYSVAGAEGGRTSDEDNESDAHYSTISRSTGSLGRMSVDRHDEPVEYEDFYSIPCNDTEEADDSPGYASDGGSGQRMQPVTLQNAKDQILRLQKPQVAMMKPPVINSSNTDMGAAATKKQRNRASYQEVRIVTAAAKIKKKPIPLPEPRNRPRSISNIVDSSTTRDPSRSGGGPLLSTPGKAVGKSFHGRPMDRNPYANV